MTRHRYIRLVLDTMVVVRGARALRQQPPPIIRPELRIIDGWLDDKTLFEWIYSQQIIDEYREVLKRLGVPHSAVGRLINVLRRNAIEVEAADAGSFSPDPKDDPFYHYALAADADCIVTDNLSDFPPLADRKRPVIVTPTEMEKLLFD